MSLHLAKLKEGHTSLNKDTIEIIVAIAGCIIGVIGAGAAVYARWKSSIEKGYAAQRDFQHLKRNQEQMVENLHQIVTEQDELKKDIEDYISERFTQNNLSLARIESMLHTLLGHHLR